MKLAATLIGIVVVSLLAFTVLAAENTDFCKRIEDEMMGHARSLDPKISTRQQALDRLADWSLARYRKWARDVGCDELTDAIHQQLLARVSKELPAVGGTVKPESAPKARRAK